MNTEGESGIFIALNCALALLSVWVAMIFSSMLNPEFSWYEPSGQQFLAILIITDPALLILAGCESYLCRSKPKYRYKKLLPWLCLIGFSLPILADWYDTRTNQIAYTVFAIVTAILAFVIAAHEILHFRRIFKT